MWRDGCPAAVHPDTGIAAAAATAATAAVVYKRCRQYTCSIRFWDNVLVENVVCGHCYVRIPSILYRLSQPVVDLQPRVHLKPFWTVYFHLGQHRFFEALRWIVARSKSWVSFEVQKIFCLFIFPFGNVDMGMIDVAFHFKGIIL